MGIIVKPTTFVDGTIPTASQFNGDYDTIYSEFNGNITNANISASAAIAESKIAFNTSTGHDHDGVDSKLIAPQAGTVIQVVQGTYATNVSSSNSTPVDTGVTATITPASTSNKVLVTVTISGFNNPNAGCGATFNLLRGASTIMTPELYFGTGSDVTLRQSLTFSYLDSPATTSATIYKVQFFLSIGTGSVQVQRDNVTSSIVLMEVKG